MKDKIKLKESLNFPRMIKQYREHLGLNQKEFGQKYGLKSNTGVSMWESGDREAPYEVLKDAVYYHFADDVTLTAWLEKLGWTWEIFKIVSSEVLYGRLINRQGGGLMQKKQEWLKNFTYHADLEYKREQKEKREMRKKIREQVSNDN